MKKILLPLAAGFISAAAITGNASAQQAADTTQNSKGTSSIYAKNETNVRSIKNAGALNEVITNATGGDAATVAATDIKNISKKAFKNFTAAFSKADDVKWFKTSGGFIAYCTVNGTRHRSVYDKYGNWLYSTQSYDEKKLPAEVRGLVKRTYYDFPISGVQEIHVADKTVYLIYLKDENTCMTIRICDDEMDVIEKFNQAH